MADEVSLVTWSGSTVTPVDDAVIYEKFSANSGIIDGCEVTISDSSTLHINAGHGIICGRKFTVVDSDIAVQLSSSDELLGRLYIHLDLSSVSTPIELLTETGASLTDEQQDDDVNIDSGVWDMNIATFTVDTSTLDNLVDVAPVMQNTNKTVATIEDKNVASQAYAIGDYLVHRGILYSVTAAIAQDGDLIDETNITATDVGSELSQLNSEIDRINSNNIGEAIALENNVSYTCTSDGYFRTYLSQDTTHVMVMYVNNNLVCRYQGGTSQPAYSIFVKKGMQIKFVATADGSGTFYPFE